ncbi:MAG: hypothetical protein Q9226_005926 [Calogaya cf. arnoldii]
MMGIYPNNLIDLKDLLNRSRDDPVLLNDEGHEAVGMLALRREVLPLIAKVCGIQREVEAVRKRSERDRPYFDPEIQLDRQEFAMRLEKRRLSAIHTFSTSLMTYVSYYGDGANLVPVPVRCHDDAWKIRTTVYVEGKDGLEEVDLTSHTKSMERLGEQLAEHLPAQPSIIPGWTKTKLGWRAIKRPRVENSIDVDAVSKAKWEAEITNLSDWVGVRFRELDNVEKLVIDTRTRQICWMQSSFEVTPNPRDDSDT